MTGWQEIRPGDVDDLVAAAVADAWAVVRATPDHRERDALIRDFGRIAAAIDARTRSEINRAFDAIAIRH